MEHWTPSFGCLFFFAEGEETLAKIIEDDENAHADQHGAVILNNRAHTAEEKTYSGFGQSVGDEITYGDIQDETKNDLWVFTFILEGKVLVEKVA